MNIQRLIITILVISSIPKTSIAQDFLTNYLEVYGHADKEIAPDEIYVAIDITEFKYEGSIVGIEQIENDILKVLSDLQIDASNLSIAWSSGYKRYREKKGDILSETRGYTLKLGDQLKLNGLISGLEKVRISSVRVTRVDHSKLDELEASVRIEAAQNARQKAQELLSELGAKVGDVIGVKEIAKKAAGRTTASDSYNRYDYRRNLNATGAVERATSVTHRFQDDDDRIGFQKIKLEYQVAVRFKIDQS